MKKSKKNYIIIALVVILLACAVGYAAFGATLKVSGTATASGKWDMHFAENPTVNGASTNTATRTASDTIDVSVALGYPGDGATVSTQILNEGTIDAKLTGFVVEGDGFIQSGNVYTNGAIKVTVPDMTIGEVVAANGTCNFAFDVEWDSSVNNLGETNSQTANFTITFTYEQSTTTFTPGVDHTDA